ncbi:MAG: fluoride efflux transporter CrcB [Bacteroidetes bacterium]|nr:fluoride efflux transporter CrcB [Bacteroidota bacterium]
MNNILLVFLGGGLGSVARFGISEIVKNNFKSSFPIATLCSNILSCLVLALMVGVFSGKADASPALKTLIVIGFCGGFSTFSTFSFETVELMRSGNMMIAIANILISVTVCVALVYFLSKQTA